jgi:hypothetical protein
MNLFLKAKHWQLFLLAFGIPLLFEFVLMFSLFSRLAQHPGGVPDPFLALGYFKFFPIIMALFIGTLLGWEWSVAIGLQKMVPAGVKMKVTNFKIFFFVPVVYMSFILVYIFYVLSANFSSFSHPEAISFGVYIYISFTLIVPIHLFSMFCLFYCIYFVAKTIKTVELQREVSFSDFIGEFFLTWFFMIGVWLLQPKINKMRKEHENAGDIAIHD